MSEPTDNNTVKNTSRSGRFLKCFMVAIKWFFIFLFAEMLVVGVMLHISWKIFLLLFVLIFLALIPKRIRKYNYIPVIILLTACNIWILVPDRDHTWVPFTFDGELSELESKYNIPDEANAAAIYSSFIEKYMDTTLHPNLFDFETHSLDYNKAFSTENYPELSKMITDQQATIDTLLKAAEYDKCRFAIPDDLAAIKDQHQRLFVFKYLGRLLINSANNDIGDNRFDQAVAKQLAALKIADHLYQQRTLLDNSAAVCIEIMALGNMNNFVMQHCTDPDVMDRLAGHLKLTDEYFPNNWPDIYGSLNLVVKNMVAMLYEVHPDGRVRRSHSLVPTINRQFGAKMRISPFQMTIVKAGAIGHWFVLPSTPRRAGNVIDEAFEYFSPTSRDDMSMPSGPKLRLNYKYVTERGARYCAQWYYSIETQSKTVASANRASGILCAIRKYYLENNRYPESLDDLTGMDPVALIDASNDESFVYKLMEDSFLLYSTGRNKIDEGGIKIPCRDYDDVRHWPQEPPEEAKLQ